MTSPAKPNRPMPLSLALGMAALVALLGGVYLVIERAMPRRFQMEGISMLPNIASGERLSCTTRTPVAGDVIVARSPAEDATVIKRVVAVGPARVSVDVLGTIEVDGVPVPRTEGCPGVDWEPFGGDPRCFLEEFAGRRVAVLEDQASLSSTTLVLREDEYFVLGDNRARSHDSRGSDFGALPRSNVLCVVSGSR